MSSQTAWPATARLAYALGVQSGLTPQQATDFASVQYGESGFNPGAVNKSSGAAGLYQLLSPGYVNRANQLGGVLDPTANIKAILPNYVHYYQSHPYQPGAAGAAVEASGEPASYYAAGLQHLHGGAAGRGVPAPAAAPAGSRVGGNQQASAQPDYTGRLLTSLIGRTNQGLGLGGSNMIAGLLGGATGLPTPAGVPAKHGAPIGPFPNPAPGTHGGIAELLSEGTGGPTHSTGPHIHAAFTSPQLELAAIARARALGLNVGENPYVGSLSPAVHAPHSYHNVDFPGKYNGRTLGEAIDVSGPQQQAFYNWLQSRR